MKPVTLPPGRARLATKPPAYRAVYPSIKSDDVAGAAAARLLGNVRVQARIAEIMRVGVSWRNDEKGKDGEPVTVLHHKHAALVSIGRYLGMFDDKVKVDAVYGISEEPMSAEEWKKQFCKGQ